MNGLGLKIAGVVAGDSTSAAREGRGPSILYSSASVFLGIEFSALFIREARVERILDCDLPLSGVKPH